MASATGSRTVPLEASKSERAINLARPQVQTIVDGKVPDLSRTGLPVRTAASIGHLPEIHDWISFRMTFLNMVREVPLLDIENSWVAADVR
jgi:hypothetical protein